MKKKKNAQMLPLMPLKDLVVFPFIYVPVYVGREFSKNAVFESIENNFYEMIVCLQKDSKNTNPSKASDLHEMGVKVKIAKVEKNEGNPGTFKLLVQGLSRVKIDKIKNNSKDECLFAEYTELPNIFFDIDSNRENKALYENLIEDLVYITERGYVSDALIPVKDVENPVAACYLFLSISKNASDSQRLLGINEPRALIKAAFDEIQKQKNMIDVKEDIIEKAKENMTKSQKDYFLKEQIKAIKKELGEDTESDIENYTKKFAQIKSFMSEPNQKEIKKNLKKLKNANVESYEVSIIRNYMDYVFSLPWDKYSEENLDVIHARKVIGDKHCFLDDVKERILEFLSVKKLNEDSKAPIICFLGPPGVGKTSFAQSIAEAIGRKSVRISLGGVRDESEIRGHRKTYIGAMAGKIMQGIHQVGTKNPVFILDEIDKITSDFRGDPSAALLEVLDPEQNSTFKDHYVNLEFDLSKVMFVATANSIDTIPGPLRDRMEIIKISGYCLEEKVEIAKEFLINKKIKEAGLTTKDISIPKTILPKIVSEYTREFGVRELERQVGKITRKVAKKKAEKKLRKKVTLSNRNIKEYLGSPRFTSVEDHKNGVGIVTGLAWTSYGGEILKLESVILPEKGDTILTGRLGETMQESAKIGVSVIKQNAKKWGIDLETFEKERLHIHFPDGATPKDGPSAGIAMVVSMVSALTKKRVKDSIAMTGEITLTGKVWPVGGIKEKVLAAIRSNIKTIILPVANKKDFEEIPESLVKGVEIKYVTKIDQVIKEIF